MLKHGLWQNSLQVLSNDFFNAVSTQLGENLRTVLSFALDYKMLSFFSLSESVRARQA